MKNLTDPELSSGASILGQDLGSKGRTGEERQIRSLRVTPPHGRTTYPVKSPSPSSDHMSLSGYDSQPPPVVSWPVNLGVANWETRPHNQNETQAQQSDNHQTQPSDTTIRHGHTHTKQDIRHRHRHRHTRPLRTHGTLKQGDGMKLEAKTSCEANLEQLHGRH